MLTRADFPYQGRCDVCGHMADLMVRHGHHICYVCSTHEGSLPDPDHGTRILVTEIRRPFAPTLEPTVVRIAP